MQFMSAIVQRLRGLDPFSKEVIYRGLQIACGIYALAYLFHFTAGQFGDLLRTLNCLNGALTAAPAIATSSVIVALLCDLELKYRKGRGDL